MFQTFFKSYIAAFVFFSGFAAHFSYAQAPRKVQTLEEINADLEVRKKELEPFDEKKVKIDVESLGLDDVDKTQQKPKKDVAEEVTKEKDKIVKDIKEKIEEKTHEEKPKEKKIEEKKAAAEAVPQNEGLMDRIEKMAQKQKPVIEKAVKKVKAEVEAAKKEITSEKSVEKKEKKVIEPKSSTERYINSTKKQNLKKRLEAERKSKEKVVDAKKEKENHEKRLEKLKELRLKYILRGEDEAIYSFMRDHDDDYFEEEKVVPHEKNLNRFISEEPPAPPIMDIYRAKDNLHIPLVLTFKEKVDILFNSISIGNPAYFNSAFSNVEDPDIKNQYGDTLLTCAILQKKYPIMASILAKGANPDLPNNLGFTPMDIALEMLDIRAIELLANNGTSLEYSDKFGRTYLMHAARLGFLPAVELLVSKGVNVNTMDDDGFTALAIAYRHKKEIIVRYLLKKGAKTWIEKPYDPQPQSLIKELENRWKQ
jgi:hypothetical protein